MTLKVIIGDLWLAKGNVVVIVVFVFFISNDLAFTLLSPFTTH